MTDQTYYMGHDTYACNKKRPFIYACITEEGFFGSQILAKKDFLGLWKTQGFFLVAKKTQGFFWLLYFSSAQINNNVSTIYCWCGIFFRYQAKNVGSFWGRQILKLEFFGVIKYEPLSDPLPPHPVIRISERGPWGGLFSNRVVVVTRDSLLLVLCLNLIILCVFTFTVDKSAHER